MDASQCIVPAQYAYLYIPANQLREFTDSLFPGLAKNGIADLATGQWHRFKHGHDLLLDVPSTLRQHGLRAAADHAGHIVLTDFPTRAGIPFPGFSAQGLGGWLHESLGVSRAWFNFNICDAGLGILAVSESTMDLLQAVHGELFMDSAWTFLDTFGLGTAEIVLGVATSNPLFLVAGLEKTLAGAGAILNSGSRAIELASNTLMIADPFAFFGAGLTSALVGFIIAGIMTKGNIQSAVAAALRSALVGSLCAISPLCGFGAALGLAAYAYGKALAKQDPLTSVSNESLRMFKDVISTEHSAIKELLSLSSKNIFLCADDKYYLIEKKKDVFLDAGDKYCLIEKSDNKPTRSLDRGLPTRYYEGLSVPKDLGQASRWMQKAAEQGNADAELMLKTWADVEMKNTPTC
jgi:hypothetical protein